MVSYSLKSNEGLSAQHCDLVRYESRPFTSMTSIERQTATIHRKSQASDCAA